MTFAFDFIARHSTGRHAPVTVYGLLALPFSVLWFCRFSGWQFVDLPSFYYGAKSTFDLFVSPYNAHLTEFAGRYVHPYLYPPQSLLFFWPLTKLGFAEAGIVLTAASLALFFLSLMMIVYALVGPAHRNILTMAACALILYSSQVLKVNLVLGQINVFVLFAICASWVFMRKSSDVGAGICLALAVLLKAHPAVLLLPLLIRKEYGVLKWFLIATAFWTAVAYFVLPAEVWTGFLHTAFGVGFDGRAGGSIDPIDVHNLSLLGAAKRSFLHAADIGRSLYYLVVILIVGISSLVVWHAKSKDAIFMTFLPVCVLMSPLAWEHHLAVLVPVFLLFLTDAATERRWLQTSAATAAFVICFAYKIPEMFFASSAVTGAVLLLWSMICWHALTGAGAGAAWMASLPALRLRTSARR